MNKFYYHTYGLTVSSEICLFELEEISVPLQVDADIVLGMPPQWVQDEYQRGSFASIKEDIMWFRIYDELLIYVEAGKHAIVWPINPDIPQPTLNTYVMSGVFTFLLFQRGHICVHGSALAYNNSAFIISGSSGSGKSTTALELLKKEDITFLSDDVCPLHKEGPSQLLLPGPPWQKVCKDVSAHESGFTYAYPDEAGGKYGRHLFDRYCATPTPVRAMFIITKEECNFVHSEELKGEQKLRAFTQNLFRGELLNILGIPPSRMLQILDIVNAFPIYRIYRPKHGNTLVEITTTIRELIKNM